MAPLSDSNVTAQLICIVAYAADVVQLTSA